MSVETEILKIIEGKKSAPLIRALLQGMSQCYRAGVALRNLAYDKQFFSSHRFPLPVISVGNIVAGGTGKTPFVLYLARELLKIGKVAILSRGYRSQIEKSGKVAKLDHEDSSCEIYGDEPSLLAKELPEAMVWVGKERVQSAKEALFLDAEFIILDDGMQHRQLCRDIEIGMMDGLDLFGRGFYLPRGLLRDSPRRLQEMDLILVSSISSESQLEEAKLKIKNYTSAPIVGTTLQVMNANEIKGKRVGAFCAIAKPERFLQTLKEAGAEVVESMTAFDHALFSKQDLSLFSKKCKAKGAELLVCTEKDAIKLHGSLDLELPILTLKTELKIFSGEAYLIDLLRKIKELWSHYHERRV